MSRKLYQKTCSPALNSPIQIPYQGALQNSQPSDSISLIISLHLFLVLSLIHLMNVWKDDQLKTLWQKKSPSEECWEITIKTKTAGPISLAVCMDALA